MNQSHFNQSAIALLVLVHQAIASLILLLLAQYGWVKGYWYKILGFDTR
ncbi:hypothetical protein GXM_01028 [Nostoc sphaeroides CCNUC1]|uniref:Uncharacterized protein n=1 Tax=Nostoc sphaeroides CCNUC1 TaxID=2653204 RepID=A0A5P8VSY4_9NOSO|nr:hypothetical protein GXM_01028 [Nostoc sphaeroides CCNUC1]